MSKTNPRSEEVRLDALTPNPLLPLLNARATDLVDDNETGGRAELHCLPNLELTGGYRRWLDLHADGVEAVAVTTRHDLAGLPADIVGLHVLKTFLSELGANDDARAALFVVWDKWRTKLSRRGRRRSRKEEIDKAILAVLGVSRRTLLRGRAALALSPEERRELGALCLPKWAVERVGRLPRGRRQQAVQELLKADDLEQVLGRLFPPIQRGRHTKAANAVAALARDLERGLADLDGRMDEAERAAPRHGNTFCKAAPVIHRLALAGADDRDGCPPRGPGYREVHPHADDQHEGESAHPEGSR